LSLFLTLLINVLHSKITAAAGKKLCDQHEIDV
jgi:hypothetical protein